MGPAWRGRARADESSAAAWTRVCRAARRDRSRLSAVAGARRGARSPTPLALRIAGRSGRQLAAALAPASGEDGPACTGLHAQPEAVGLGPSAVVRLEGALAHCRSPGDGADAPQERARRRGCWRACMDTGLASLRTAQGGVKHVRADTPQPSLWTTLAGRAWVLLASATALLARRGARDRHLIVRALSRKGVHGR